MPITSGSIEYERRLNLGEYNHKNVVAKVSWTIEPGEDDDVLAAFSIDKAVMRVKAVLNWKPAEPNPEPEKYNVEYRNPCANALRKTEEEPNLENQAAPNLAAQHAAAEITAGIPPALKRHRRTKAEMEAARAAAEAGPRGADLVGPTPSSVIETQSDPQNEPGMPSFDPDPPQGSAEVTDQDLLDACQAKASSGKSVTDIKELVASFSPGGLVQTPQDARRRFLDELAKL